ncbi:hypothetical protein HMPREF1092_00929 [Clostridium thermobutyricum]|uniref:Uncharacterized protein n=1 Tax=Clostridium thermobutyricum TaxID=29372 RepID=N9WFS1_9CLOT|nr:hypothetical protein [Clostridium thermobutyricum]ENZ01695.1 hypothetical protein HMPREF1092_00929 [Clostridium thermobutyricum]
MEQSSFFNAEKTANGTYDRTYNAEDWAAYFATFVGNGVSCTPTTNLQVESSSGMNVIVNSGVAFINGYRYENTTPLTVQINQANSTYDRITSIILELNLNNRNIICTTLDGTAEPNPQPPTLIRTDSIYQLQLATVYISAGATNCGAITDTRENKEVCGFLNILVPANNNLNYLAPILNGYYMGNQTAITGKFISDFDTVLEAGYYSYATSMNTKHIPPNCAYGVVVVIVGSVAQGQISYNNLNNWIWQIVYDTSGIVTMRYAVDSGWSSWSVMATTSNETFENPTFIGTITNKATVTGGTYKNACVEDTGINSCGISDSTLSGSIVNKAIVTGGEYENPTLTGKVNINDGLFNNGNPIVNASTLNVSNVHVQDNVTGTINLEYWALNAGLLSTTTNNLTCGIIKASITLDSNCTWTNKNPIYLNVEGFPNANAMTVTYQKNFVVGCGQNVIVLNGNNAYLNANQTYTEYALIYG